MEEEHTSFAVEEVGVFLTAVATALVAMERHAPGKVTSYEVLGAVSHFLENPNSSFDSVLLSVQTEPSTHILFQMLRIGVDEAKELNPPLSE